MNRFYKRGADREYYLKKKFEKEGWLVFRCAASRPFDLILIKKGKCECGREIPIVRFIESKKGKRKYVRPKQRKKFEEIEKRTGIKIEIL